MVVMVPRVSPWFRKSCRLSECIRVCQCNEGLCTPISVSERFHEFPVFPKMVASSPDAKWPDRSGMVGR